MEEKNPFSLFDFLGYFFPGAFALLILWSLYIVCTKDNILPISYITESISYYSNGKALDIVKVAVPFILFAYILGHLISYLSAISVEFFTNKAFGYPSMYLLSNKSKDVHDNYWYADFGYKPKPAYHFKFIKWQYTIHGKLGRCIDFLCNAERKVSLRLLYRIVLWFMLLPISMIVMGCKRISRPIVDFVTRPQDRYIINCIEEKLFALADELGVKRPPINLQCDFHRIVMHYVYVNCKECQAKVDNYVALYGFLRAITLILCLFTDFVLLQSLFVLLKLFWVEGFCNVVQNYSFSWLSVLFIFVLWLSSVISYFGYVKFLRRFTLENYMTLLSYKTPQMPQGISHDS